jgi:hypothetical protein
MIEIKQPLTGVCQKWGRTTRLNIIVNLNISISNSPPSPSRETLKATLQTQLTNIQTGLNIKNE